MSDDLMTEPENDTADGDAGDVACATIATPGSSARSGFALLAGTAAFTVLGIQAGWGIYLLFGAILALVIMLHELGHFLTAKASGMKVTQFFLGFGPRIWSFHRGETEYGVKALPLGGYVRIIGMHNLENVDPVDEPRSYRQATFPRRLAVAGAGSFVHAVIAFVLLVLLIGPIGRYSNKAPTKTLEGVSEQLTIGGSPPKNIPAPAFVAGLRPGDTIVAINGVAAADWNAIARTIQRAPGKTLRVDIDRGGARLSIDVRPAALETPQGDVIGMIGVTPVRPVTIERQGLGSAIGAAFRIERSLTVDTVRAFGSFFEASNLRSYTDELARAGTGRDPAVAPEDQNRFVSPVGAARIADDLYRSGGVRDLMWLLVIINVSVGVLNMIPLLPFDGGHVAIAIYERVRSRRGRRHSVDVGRLMPLTYAVVTILILIGLSSMYLDVVRPPDVGGDAPTTTVTTSTPGQAPAPATTVGR